MTDPTDSSAPGWACIDCTVLLANGDTPGDWDEDRTDAWVEEIERRCHGYLVTLGRVTGHLDCEHEDWNDEDHAYRCERLDFTWSSCDVCGSRLGGERNAVTFTPETGSIVTRPDLLHAIDPKLLTDVTVDAARTDPDQVRVEGPVVAIEAIDRAIDDVTDARLAEAVPFKVGDVAIRPNGKPGAVIKVQGHKVTVAWKAERSNRAATFNADDLAHRA